MSFDYAKLKGKIKEVFGTQTAFAKAMGVSEKTLSLKLNNKMVWKQNEISNALQLLKIEETDIQIYFFKVKVQNIERKVAI